MSATLHHYIAEAKVICRLTAEQHCQRQAKPLLTVPHLAAATAGPLPDSPDSAARALPYIPEMGCRCKTTPLTCGVAA